MTALSTLEAYDLLRHCATLAERIARAEVDQLSRAGLEDEKVWLHEALERVEPWVPVIDEMLRRCRDLPELAPAREDHAQVVQGAWVDALERLVGGITHHAGSRAPILETLFPHLKFPPLRRASPEVVRAYAADLERRSRLGYVKRIFSGEDFAFVEPLVLAVFERLAEWESCFEPGSLTEEEAAPLREELAALTATVERHMRQARLLAEASLCPVEGAFESSGIGARPRRRVGTVEIDTPPGLDPEPIDDGVSLAEALGWDASQASDAEERQGAPAGEDASTPAAEAADDAQEDEAVSRPEPSDDHGEVDAGPEGRGAPPEAPPHPTSTADVVEVPDADGPEAALPEPPVKPSRGRGGRQKKKATRKATAADAPAAPAATDAAELESAAPSASEASKPSSSAPPASEASEPSASGSSGSETSESSASESSTSEASEPSASESSASEASEPSASEPPASETSESSASESPEPPASEASPAAAAPEAETRGSEPPPRTRRGRRRAAAAVAPADD